MEQMIWRFITNLNTSVSKKNPSFSTAIYAVIVELVCVFFFLFRNY
jgi:hypothetical protein